MDIYVKESTTLWDSNIELKDLFANKQSFATWLGGRVWKLPKGYTVKDLIRIRKKQLRG